MREAMPGSCCPGCQKPAELCVCAAIAPIDNRIAVLILQHPQEQDRLLGTAGLLHKQLRNSRLAIGLSWPSLSAALGRAADPRRWGTLYLGAQAENPPPPPFPDREGAALLQAVGREGAPLPDQAAALAEMDGLILLDGSWSQAKALWWRNSWLLKTRRLVLIPLRPSLYGELRREPRPDSISTIEAGALSLAFLEHEPALAERLLRPFALLIERYRAAAALSPKARPRPRKGRPPLRF